MLHLIPFTTTWTNGFMSGIKGFLTMNSAKWSYKEQLDEATEANICQPKQFALKIVATISEYVIATFPASCRIFGIRVINEQHWLTMWINSGSYLICMASAPERRSKLLNHKICGIVSEDMKHVLPLTSLHLSETWKMTNRHIFRGNFHN